MTKTPSIFLLLFLAACTTAADIQRYCAETSPGFPEEVRCLENLVMQEPGLRDDNFVREYLFAGKVLAEKSLAGEISENEAHLQLAREYNRMILHEQQYQAYNALQFEALRPRQTICRQDDDFLFCDTF